MPVDPLTWIVLGIATFEAILILVTAALNFFVAPKRAAAEADRLITVNARAMVREELATLSGSISEALGQSLPTLFPKVPTPDELAAALKAQLVPPAPTPEQVEAAKKAAGEQQRAFVGALIEQLRPAVRAEIEAVVDTIPDTMADAETDNAAKAFSYRGVQARYDYAGQEDLFLGAVEKHAGAAGLIAVEELREARPKVYRRYAAKGIRGAQDLAKEAGALGIKLPGDGTTANLPAGVGYIV